MPQFNCRFLCDNLSLLAVYTSDRMNPVDAAEAAARWGGDLAYARIDVWDGEQRILIRKRS